MKTCWIMDLGFWIGGRLMRRTSRHDCHDRNDRVRAEGSDKGIVPPLPRRFVHIASATCRPKGTMHLRHLNISNRQVAAFTLVELLTATAIMALILVLLLQILNGILDSTRVQNQQMEAVGSARRALDVIASDLRNAVISENSSILTAGSSNSFALLAARRGTNGATGHRYLAVLYSTNSSNQIIRSYGSSTFSGTNPLADAAMNATVTPFEPLARGILAFQARILADGSNAYPLTATPSGNWATNNYNGVTSPSGWNTLITRSPSFAAGLTNRARAMDIWIVSIDDQNGRLFTNNSSWVTSVGTALSGTNVTGWRSAIDGAAIPGRIKSALRVLNKTIPLP
ncbi:MAG: hypothetical protein ORN23_08555 [Chthoniobacterales bacterium]|nr:hypothetical protein [Chthoniobacterales bacterium]